MHPRTEILALIQADETRPFTETQLGERGNRAFVAVERADVSEATKWLMFDLIEMFITARIGMTNSVAGPFDWLGLESRKTLGFCDYFSHHRRARAELLSRLELFDTPSRPGGYTAGELRHEAQIGKTLWQLLVKTAGIERTIRGNAGRRFANAEIRQLAVAAQKHGTPRSIEAANRLLALAARNV